MQEFIEYDQSKLKMTRKTTPSGDDIALGRVLDFAELTFHLPEAPLINVEHERLSWGNLLVEYEWCLNSLSQPGGPDWLLTSLTEHRRAIVRLEQPLPPHLIKQLEKQAKKQGLHWRQTKAGYAMTREGTLAEDLMSLDLFLVALEGLGYELDEADNETLQFYWGWEYDDLVDSLIRKNEPQLAQRLLLHVLEGKPLEAFARQQESYFTGVGDYAQMQQHDLDTHLDTRKQNRQAFLVSLTPVGLLFGLGLADVLLALNVSEFDPFGLKDKSLEILLGITGLALVVLGYQVVRWIRANQLAPRPVFLKKPTSQWGISEATNYEKQRRDASREVKTKRWQFTLGCGLLFLLAIANLWLNVFLPIYLIANLFVLGRLREIYKEVRDLKEQIRDETLKYELLMEW